MLQRLNLPGIDPSVSASLIVGAVGAGKTFSLVKRICSSAHEGGRILVLCATPQAAVEMKHRIHLEIGRRAAEAPSFDTNEVSERIHVCTARDKALSILSSKGAQAFTGRKPHVATPLERVFITEDMKTCGIRPKRLQEMMKFFFRSWTELEDDEDGWLLKGEEQSVHGLLKSILSLYQVILEPELGNLAIHYLRFDEQARSEASYDHVFVDDMQTMNRSSQLLANMLATKSITATWDERASVTVFDSYPYDKGAEELQELHDDVSVTRMSDQRRCKASVAASQTVLKAQARISAPNEDDGTSLPPLSPDARPHIRPAKGYVDELKEIVRIVKDERELIDHDTRGIHVAIAAPNDVWARNIKGSLQRAGIDAEMMPNKAAVIGDVRKNDRCVPARVLCALQLIADPTDSMAWRMWCGFGDYLTNSNAFVHIRAISNESNRSVPEVISALANDELDTGASEQRVAQAYLQGQSIIKTCAGLSGMALLEKICECMAGDTKGIPDRVIRLCEPEIEGSSAREMNNRARETQTEPTVQGHAVAILPYDQLVGVSPDVLIVSGCNNGFFPIRKFFDLTKIEEDRQRKMHERDTRRAYALFGKAGQSLFITWIQRIELEYAEAMDLKIKKITIENGRRVCTLTPSMYIRGL